MAFRHLLGTSGNTPSIIRSSLGGPRNHATRPAHLSVMDSNEQFPSAADSVITLQQLAAKLGVTVQTLYDLRSQGRGPNGFRIGRQLRFRTTEVDAWLRRLEDADRTRHLPDGPR